MQKNDDAEEPLRAMFDAMPQLGWAARPDGHIYYYNQRWYEYTGTTFDEMQGWGWRSVHDPALLPSVVERWSEALRSGAPFEMAFTLRRHDGARRWFLTRATPMRDARGEIVRWVGINTDVHDQRVAQHRLETLAALAIDLSAALSRDEVARVIVESGMRAAGADTCTLYLLDEASGALALIDDRGVAPEVLSKIQRLSTGPVFDQLRSGEALWVETPEQYASRLPVLAGAVTIERRARAFWSVPLVVENRPIGLLGMGFYRPRTFSLEERAYVETFTKHCAQALLRAVRLENEDKARRALSTTLRSIGDAVIATDTQGLVTFMNPIAEALTGFSEAEALGQDLEQIFRVFSEKTGAKVESPVARVLQKGSVVGLANHTVLLSRDGRKIPVQDSGAPIKDARGAILGVVLVFRDATADKLAETRREFLVRAGDALASSLDYRTTLATLAELAVPGFADLCSVHLIESSSGFSRQIAVAYGEPHTGASTPALGEREPNDMSPHGVLQVIQQGKARLYPEVVTSEVVNGRDAQVNGLRGARACSAVVVPLSGRRGAFGAIALVSAGQGRPYNSDDLAFAEEIAQRAAMAIETAISFRDLEAAREVERSLRHDAEIANRAKDQFLATVSHELRTPLAAILGWAVTLRTRKLPPDLERPLAVIERNAQAQRRLIEDVLDLSRIISGKLSLSLEPVNLADVALAAIEAVMPAAEAKDIALDLALPEAGPQLTADPDRLQQVVWNLISNAVKFTPQGGSVRVRVTREANDAVLSVEDSGEGIAPDMLPLIFEPFLQADASTTRRHGGLGLGLAIVKQLVVAHGGVVRASSDGVGRGARFVVTLPVRAGAAIAARERLSPDPREVLGPALEEPSLAGLRLLVVDDEEDTRAFLVEVLSQAGAEVHFASSVAEALPALAEAPPDVLISDIGMPDADGYQLIKRVRALPAERGGRTPAIALTAYAHIEDAQRAFASGYQRHVAKPVDPGQLTRIVANLAGRILAP